MKIKDIIDRLFENLRRKKVLEISDGREENSSNKKNDLKVNTFKHDIKVDTLSIDEAFKEYIDQYKYVDKNYKTKDKSYRALVRLFCGENEDPGENKKNQENLKKVVRKNGCDIGNQMSQDRVAFIHIQGKDPLQNEYKYPDLEKIYINCDRKNISNLAKEVFLQIKDVVKDNLTMKFIAEQYENLDPHTKESEENYQRNDKIVIYAKDHETAEKVLWKIAQIEREKPEFFSRDKKLPFLPNNGICKHAKIGKFKLGTVVKTPLGMLSGATYNEIISNIIEQSIVAGFDEEILGKFGDAEGISNRLRQYAKITNPEQFNRAIKSATAIFRDACKNSNINTEYTNKKTEENKIKNYEGEEYV